MLAPRRPACKLLARAHVLAQEINLAESVLRILQDVKRVRQFRRITTCAAELGTAGKSENTSPRFLIAVCSNVDCILRVILEGLKATT
jgi:hypothetical protein